MIEKEKKHEEADNHKHKFTTGTGINEDTIKQISKYKNEPEWMLNHRLKSFKLFKEMPMPKWGPSLKKLDLNKICYFAVPDADNTNSWDKVPEDIKKTFDKLGIPEAERKALAGAGAQYDSQTVYHNLKKDLKEKGVIFEDMDVAVKKYPELIKKYFIRL